MVGLPRWGISHIAGPLPTQDKTDTEETHTAIHASSDIRPTIPVFERKKTFHALDRAITVIGDTGN
jgi:hypothetical protein